MLLFESEDPIERDIVKNILHKIYAKVIGRRKMLKKHMSECLLSLIHEEDSFKGTAEMFEVLYTIVHGYAVPLRQEHIDFFNNVMVPLHKVRTYPTFYDQFM